LTHSLKLNLHSTSLGGWVTLGHSSIVEILANAGFDWIVIDLEHSDIDISTAADMIRTADLCGVPPLVRLTSNQPDQIKRVMDAGASGIIVPSVNTHEEASSAVSATRYAPFGTRGVGLARAQSYGASFKSYWSWQLDDPTVVVMIEHLDAVKNLERILTTPGVSAFLIGPYDLSASMGIPGEFDNPLFTETIQNIKNIGKRLGCPTGIHIVEPELDSLSKAILDGYNFIAYGVDIRMLDLAARKGVALRDKVYK
jgi:2-keto-3-deoxy-L-rhamnonate aldolase RhmA